MPQSEPTVRSRMIGKELRRLRERAGLTLEEAGAFLDRSGSSVSRYENGHHAIRPIELRHTLDVYRVADPAVRDALLSLARQGRQKGWWRDFKHCLSPAVLDFVSLEADAEEIDIFQLNLVPGILQSEGYARSLFRAGITVRTPADEDRLVEFRMARRRIVTQERGPRISVVLGESALCLHLDRQIMRAQLSHLLCAAQRENVTLRILPFSAGPHAGFDGSFTVFRLGEQPSMKVVHLDGLTRGWYLEEREEIEKYFGVMSQLRSMALSEADSIAFIQDISSGV